MKIAILGLAQSGKKTLFALLTGKPIPEFLKTGETLKGMAKVQDERIDQLNKMYNPKKKVLAETEFILSSDIESGTGNYRWLEEARTCDLLCFVVRDFQSEDVFHPAGSVNAQRDKGSIEAELILADLALVETRLERINKDKVKTKFSQKQIYEHEALLKCQPHLEAEKMLNSLELSDNELDAIASLNFVTRKNILWCFNIDETRIPEFYPQSTNDLFYISALIEKEISEIENHQERKEYMDALEISIPGINRLNQTAYDQLGLMSFYTVGPDEVRAWTISKNCLAPIAGGKIHSDIERGFIRVEIMKYDELIKAGNEQALKNAGKFMMKGRDYIIQDGDICHFLFNV